MELGDTAADKISGFGGTITAWCDYLDANARAQVTPRYQSGSEFVEAQWFDVDRLVPTDPA